MTTNTRSANARTLPTRRDALGALFTTGTAAAASAGLLGVTLQPAPADPIGDLIAGQARLQAAVDELMAAAEAAGHRFPVWHVSLPQSSSDALLVIGSLEG